jgi:hypothetical protein
MKRKARQTRKTDKHSSPSSAEKLEAVPARNMAPPTLRQWFYLVSSVSLLAIWTAYMAYVAYFQ